MSAYSTLYCSEKAVKLYVLLKTQKTDSCWLWGGGKSQNGYGSFWMNKKAIPAHRASFMLFNGVIGDGNFVCHTCDNPICVNPDHLFLGNQSDNMKDMSNKGRGVATRGEFCGASKLCVEDVVEIKRLLVTGKRPSVIARMFDVHRGTITNIRDGITWTGGSTPPLAPSVEVEKYLQSVAGGLTYKARRKAGEIAA